MNKTLLYDLYRYEGTGCNSFKTRIRYIMFTPGFQFTYIFRKASEANNIFTKIFWRVLHRWCMFHTGIQIPVGTKIGEGLKIGHFGNIVINPATEIGRNFNIAQGCLIGSSEGRNKGIPRIGDNVVMSANSVIIGGVNIGNNVLIAPNAFINFDVPSNSIVIGNPGKIILRESSPTDKYMVYKI